MNSTPPRTTEAGAEHPCPSCHGQNVASILYGLPYGEDLDGREAAGEVVLGGCVIDLESPRFQCNDCGHAFGDLGLSTSVRA